MVVIIGIPNAGKTTYSRRYDGVVHYDDLNLTTRQRYEHFNALAKQGNAVFEGVFGSKNRRVELVASCPEGEKKVCVWLDTSLTVCLERERTGRMRGDHIVLSHARTFEPPTYDEGWDEIIIERTE